MNLLNAWSFAEDQRTPLDLHIVIHWDRIGLVAGASILQAQAKFLDHLSRWFHKREKPFAYLWTIEFGARKGTHTHLLLSTRRVHASDVGELLRGLPKLLVCNVISLHPAAIKVDYNCHPLPYAPERRGRIARTENQRRGLLAYICKGLHPTAAARVGINAEDQGEVRVRRCGVSRSLDWAARRRAGWAERPLEHFDFTDLAEKRRDRLAEASQRRVRASQGAMRTPSGFPMPGHSSAAYAPRRSPGDRPLL